ncbi:hypothetical protein O6H91_22G060100 [Diphasiastrum complanatum]|uniref:Uncharacterized protein n=1 Tax=Diphasiastrum complanatum TaxID=34168 RepID=A0ACC2AGB2_DIPCM|nr:hypothetical protein O6H91_22G060100 [Diphasiastrum complanatum]
MAILSRGKSFMESMMGEGSPKDLFGRGKREQQEQKDTQHKLERTASGGRRWIKELSSLANVVVGQCARILLLQPDELQQHFEEEAPVSAKYQAKYARNLLEYCCFQALSVATRVSGHLKDKDFRRLTFDMMLAWEAPGVSSTPSVKVDVESTVGPNAFARLAPAIPVVADIVTAHYQFEALTASTGGRLSFPVYDKYLGELEKSIRTMKSLATPSLISTLNIGKDEMVIDVDGTATTQPVLQHIGLSTWPGRLTLTDQALYCEALRVVSYDKPKKFELSADLRHVVKPDLTGPWGARLFDKAVMYKSDAVPEPVVLEFPELTGHTRRDYWFNIIREVVLAHNFIRKYHLESDAQAEAQAKAVLGIARLRATKETFHLLPVRPDLLLTFSVAEQLPGGDIVLEALADKLRKGDSEISLANELAISDKLQSNHGESNSVPSPSESGARANVFKEDGMVVGHVLIGDLTQLEKAVLQSQVTSKKVEAAQATIDGVKVEGIGTNLAVMKELLDPIILFGSWLQAIAAWHDPFQSSMFLLVMSYIIYRNWLGFVLPTMLAVCIAHIMRLRYMNKGPRNLEVVVPLPPRQNTLEQLMVLQEALNQLEEIIQSGNIFLLKIHALFLSALPQATDQVIWLLSGITVVLACIPFRIIFLIIFLDIFTRQNSIRRESTERLMRRLRDWWYGIPVISVRFIKPKDKTQ